MPAIPAPPPPAMHAIPAPAAPVHAPVVTGGHVPVAGAHPTIPVAGNHMVSPRGSGPAHPGTVSGSHTVTHGTTPAAKPISGQKASTGFPVNPIYPTPPGPQKPFIPGFLPPDTFSGQSCYFGNCYPVPGFGFDYEHFFAVHPNWNQYQSRYSGVVIPGWGGGFYYPVPYYSEPGQQEAPAEAAPAEEQPSNAAAAYAPANQEPAPAANRSYNYSPTQPVDEYVFVKRDGTRIFAVAYSLTKDRLQYITKEGLRRTLALDALDYDATMKSNEERGNTVNLPGAPPAAMAMAR